MVGFPRTQNKLKDLILQADNDEAADVHNSEYIQSTGWLNISSCSATQHMENTVIQSLLFIQLMHNYIALKEC
jgi:hypothetical protein